MPAFQGAKFEENLLSLSQHPSLINSSSASCSILWAPTSTKMGCCLDRLFLWVQFQLLWVNLHNNPALHNKLFFYFRCPPLLGLLIFLPFSIIIPEPCSRNVLQMSNLELSITQYLTIYMLATCRSLLFTIYCKRKLLWWDLRDA